jgi:hypothetical protein
MPVKYTSPKYYREIVGNIIINPGRPDCRHISEVKKRLDHGNHLIGECRLCGKVIDYTVAQAPIDIISGDHITKTTMDRMVGITTLSRGQSRRSKHA